MSGHNGTVGHSYRLFWSSKVRGSGLSIVLYLNLKLKNAFMICQLLLGILFGQLTGVNLSCVC